MKAQIKSLYSLEIEDPLINYYPTSERNFGSWIRMHIGPENENSSEAFDIFICSPEWIKEKCNSGEIIYGKNLMILDFYDYKKIESAINKYLFENQANDWISISHKISKIAIWEFEDYR